LENTDHEITVIDNLRTGFKSTIDILKQIRDFQFIEADLNNWEEIEGIFKAKKIQCNYTFCGELDSSGKCRKTFEVLPQQYSEHDQFS
jgi:UDP-glucose 4-epimerase